MKKASTITMALVMAALPATAQLALAQESMTEMAPAATSAVQAAPTLDTASSDQFLQSLADKFGTTTSYLKELLAKLPPSGPGLSRLEIWGISSKLKLNDQEKAVFKAKAGPGGSGFNAEDLAGMGARLGLNSGEVARLSAQLGLTSPAIATPVPVTPMGQAQQAGVISAPGTLVQPAAGTTIIRQSAQQGSGSL
jgi:hypothetical protein